MIDQQLKDLCDVKLLKINTTIIKIIFWLNISENLQKNNDVFNRTLYQSNADQKDQKQH